MAHTKEWWPIIEALARYTSMGVDAEAIFDEHVLQALIAEGYDLDHIDHALNWLEEASTTCDISEILASMQSVSHSTRISTRLEEKCIPDRMRRHIDRATNSGILSTDFSERLRESIITMETKDWSESDQIQFVMDIMQSNLPHHKYESLRKFLMGKTTEFYC